MQETDPGVEGKLFFPEGSEIDPDLLSIEFESFGTSCPVETFLIDISVFPPISLYSL